jgi:ABC-type amino acid transport substrate-binding protein
MDCHPASLSIVQRIGILILIFTGLLVSSPSYAELPNNSQAASQEKSQQHLRFGLYNFPPFAEKTETGIKGIWVDALANTATEAGYTYDINIFPPKRLQLLIHKGEIDLSIVVIDHYDLIPERTKYSEKPIFELDAGIASLLPAAPQEINELFFKKVGAVRGYSYGTGRQRLNKHSDKIEIIESKDHNQLLRMLSANRIDYALTYKQPMLYEKEKIRSAREIYFSTIAKTPFHFLISKEREEYQTILRDLESAFFRLNNQP